MLRDCPNAEIRDRLPELMHGRLTAAERARVESHVVTCADCRAELELLRRARASLSKDVVAIDVGRMAAAVASQSSAAAHARPAGRSRFLREWSVPRAIAATIVFVAVGGTALMIAARGDDVMQRGGSRVAIESTTVAGGTRTTDPGRIEPVVAPSPGGQPRSGISLGGGLGDLSESELQSLLSALEGFESVPSEEPAAVIEPIAIGLEG